MRQLQTTLRGKHFLYYMPFHMHKHIELITKIGNI